MKLNSLEASKVIPPEPVVIIAALVPKPVLPKVTGFTVIVEPSCLPTVAVAVAPMVDGPIIDTKGVPVV